MELSPLGGTICAFRPLLRERWGYRLCPLGVTICARANVEG